ncbi:MAG: 2TM domain-containing protein [Acidimicrobiales bacterium]|nr:2TM domain-containing protein [Acidimicrobiales bacterium]
MSDEIRVESDDPREEAIKRLKARREFLTHVVTYVVVNAFLIGVWFVTGAGYFWPVWVLGGWGIGLVLHAWTTFAQKPITEAEIEREMHRHGPPAAPA